MKLFLNKSNPKTVNLTNNHNVNQNLTQMSNSNAHLSFKNQLTELIYINTTAAVKNKKKNNYYDKIIQ